MILVFGGTTEGRRAVEVLEEAGALYYYSTRSDGQQIELVNGVHLTGGMDVPQMVDCCREHGVRLLIDAAHPFAEELHRNLLFVARHIGAPIIRYDRIYPPRSNDVVWCKDYGEALSMLEAEGIERLLALTGVNNIGTLRPYWERHECWVRILNRPLSQTLARKAQFPADHLVYYEDDDTRQLLEQLKPQAILTKESGLSGGFTEKVEAARAAGVRVFVIERPEYPPHTPNPQDVRIEYVNGPHGLRRAVEHLLPEFFPLKSGLTTGTCATAAAVAATLQLLHKLNAQPLPSHDTLNGRPSAFLPSLQGEGLGVGSVTLPKQVPVILPDGEAIRVPVHYEEDTDPTPNPSPTREGSGCASLPLRGCATCVKEAGDDPDVTNGIKVRATVEQADHFEILGGEGVGRFTLPGFDFPPGEPAINKGPHEMIAQNIKSILSRTPNTQHPTPNTQHPTPNTQHPTPNTQHLKITISVPGGEEIAKRTFNPRLGIEGGISIIGVSGIVKPFSEEAFISSIRKCMEVAKASGTDRVVINSGAKSERFVKERYPELPRQAFVEYGNYIGHTLRMADELGFRNVTLGVMLGKAVKLAEGQLDTHSRKGTMNKDFIQQMLHESGYDIDITDITLARELWDKLRAASPLTQETLRAASPLTQETLRAASSLTQETLRTASPLTQETLRAASPLTQETLHTASPLPSRGGVGGGVCTSPFAHTVIRHCLTHCAPLLPNGNLTILLIDDDGHIYE